MEYNDFLSIVCGGKDYERLDEMNKINAQLMLLFMMLCNHRFEWKGLPDELPSWVLERVINFYGGAVVFKYAGKLIATSYTQVGDIDIYGFPTRVRPIAFNGTSFDDVFIGYTLDSNKNVISPNAVVIRNNDVNMPTYFMLKPVVDRLCFIWESLGINEGLSRVKALIHANKDVSGTIKTEIKKIFGTRDAFAVVSDKLNLLKSIEKVDLDVQYTPMEYWNDFDRTFNFACQLVGITTNMNSDKKERLLTAEIESNDELTTIVEDTCLDHRKIASEKMNKMFGMNTSVENKVPSSKMTKPSDNASMKNNTPPLWK